MTSLPLTAVPHQGSDVRPMPWRRMAWVTWRQHRPALVVVAALLGVLAALLVLAGLQLHHAYASALACHTANYFACEEHVNSFNGMNGFLANGSILQAIPVLIGAFVGAPLLARELETGTFRFAWTQGIGRTRWTLTKLVGLGAVLAIVTGALGLLTSWYYQPYFAASNGRLSLNEVSPLAPGLFDIRGLAIVAWTLVAFAIGVLAGAVLRRVVPAIVAALVLYAGLAFAVAGLLRQHYLTPVVTRMSAPSSGWVLAQHWFTKGGEPASNSLLNRVVLGAPASLFTNGLKSGTPKSATISQYLASQGFTLRMTYQPGKRFWSFQLIEAGWLIVLSALLVAGAVWIVRRRAS